MTIYTINPDTWTKIGDGDCVVISEYRTELVYFRLDNGESVTSYLGKQLLVKNTGDLFAKSNRRTIEVKSTAADAAVRKNAVDIITTNTALTANTDKDLETKNALEAKDADQDSIIAANKAELEAKDVLLEQSIADNALADSNLSTVVDGINTRLTDLELKPVKNVNTGLPLSFWLGTQAELDLIIDKDANTVYTVQE